MGVRRMSFALFGTGLLRLEFDRILLSVRDMMGLVDTGGGGGFRRSGSLGGRRVDEGGLGLLAGLDMDALMMLELPALAALLPVGIELS